MLYERSWKVRGRFRFIELISKLIDSRVCNRLSYDAAIAKAEKFKNSKKEKDRREVEEELERAQYR